MKTILALALFATGSLALPQAAHLEPLGHRLFPRLSSTCRQDGNGTMKCTMTYDYGDMPAACRDSCHAVVDIANCMAKANPDKANNPTPSGGPAPSTTGALSPMDISVNTTALNEPSKECFKNGYCPHLDEFVGCYQCIVNISKASKDTKQTGVMAFNGVAQAISKSCGELNFTASNYSQVTVDGKVPNSARAASGGVAGSLLVALGVAAAASIL